jgi:3-hydroxyacyl-[acyl-carrier-protein] dehydratase
MDDQLASIIPHRPPMVFIDRLVRCSGESAIAAKTFLAGEYPLDGRRVTESALVEALAQTVAALCGQHALSSGSSSGEGMLVGISDFVFSTPVWCDDALELRIALTRRIDPFVLAHGTVLRDDVVVAEGNLKLIVREAAPHAAQSGKGI